MRQGACIKHGLVEFQREGQGLVMRDFFFFLVFLVVLNLLCEIGMYDTVGAEAARLHDLYGG